MQFPIIASLDDVTPHVTFDQGFAVSRRHDHTVIDYVFTVPETFSTAIACECRGLKFDAAGRIIGRPFHKFFNLGERERIEDIDWTSPHLILDKLDGSMVHPVLMKGVMVFMTRKGATRQAAAAQAEADAGLIALSQHLLAADITPIFEFTSPDHRIVVPYPKPALTLLAARAMVSGAYWPQSELDRLGNRFGVPVVKAHGRVRDAAEFARDARSETGIEGYVICFENGFRVKLKTDAYALRHKALSGVQFEKNVLAWVATEAIDDVVAILPEDLAARVLAYQASVHRGLAGHARDIANFAAEHGALSRKEFAALAMQRFDKRLTPAVFAALDGKNPRHTLGMILKRASSSDVSVDAIRDLFGMQWSVEGLTLPELDA